MGHLDSANWEKYYPTDLLINTSADSIIANSVSDKNYFTLPVPNLKIDSSYAFQFQYVFEDGEVSAWSPVKSITTSTESVPAAPTATVTGGAGFIKVELPTFPSNALRVDVRIAGGTFGSGTVVAESFTSAGVKTIAALGAASPGNAYVVTLLTVTPSKINGDPTSATTVYVTDPAASIAVEPSVTPSAPTVSPVLGAIQLAWNGKTSSGGNQPAGFDAAKVYVGTSADFTPVDTGNSGANQVDILNFANGQNTLNIAVGTVVNGTALTYGIDYYVKIKTTNGNIAQDSTAVAATGNPVQIGKVGSGDIVSITADQITTGTISSQIVTVGTTAGKHVKLSGTGDPLTIYGTGGINDSILSFGTNAENESVLTIKGNGTFSGALSAASGTFAGNITASAGTFSVNNGVLTAQSGTIGGWTINGAILESTANNSGQIKFVPITANGGKIALLYGGVEKITIDAVEGIVGPNITYNGISVPSFKLTPSGNLTLYGSITVTGGNAATSDQVNLKNKTFVQNDAPTNPISGYSLVAGDLWFDANDNNKQYRWSGSAWEIVQDGTISAAKTAADEAKAKADTSLQQGGNEIINASNQITTINSTGIKVTGSAFNLNGNGTPTTASASSMVINSLGITAQNASGQTTFGINALTGDAEFKGTITGSRIQTTTDSNFGSIRIGYSTEGFGAGSTLEVVGANGGVYGQLYQFNNGSELILRHGSSRQSVGYPTSSAYISLNTNTLSIGYTNSSGDISRGLLLESTAGGSTLQSATFFNMAVTATGTNSSGGANSVGNTSRNFRNTVINNTSPSGSGFSIGDIWIQY